MNAIARTHEQQLKLFRNVPREIKTRMEFWLPIDRERPDLTPR